MWTTIRMLCSTFPQWWFARELTEWYVSCLMALICLRPIQQEQIEERLPCDGLSDVLSFNFFIWRASLSFSLSSSMWNVDPQWIPMLNGSDSVHCSSVSRWFHSILYTYSLCFLLSLSSCFLSISLSLALALSISIFSFYCWCSFWSFLVSIRDCRALHRRTSFNFDSNLCNRCMVCWCSFGGMNDVHSVRSWIVRDCIVGASKGARTASNLSIYKLHRTLLQRNLFLVRFKLFSSLTACARIGYQLVWSNRMPMICSRTVCYASIEFRLCVCTAAVAAATTTLI